MDIMREFVCAAFLLSGISVLESGNNVYRMISAVIKGVGRIVPLTLGSSADLSSSVR